MVTQTNIIGSDVFPMWISQSLGSFLSSSFSTILFLGSPTWFLSSHSWLVLSSGPSLHNDTIIFIINKDFNDFNDFNNDRNVVEDIEVLYCLLFAY